MRTAIPIQAKVICTDGEAGTSKAVIVEPVRRRVTHVVVREHRPHSERLVPIGLVEETSEDAIWLRCSRDELHGLDDFIEGLVVDTAYAIPPFVGPSYEWSFSNPLVVSDRIPKGELPLRRYSVVEATDGSVGHVESLVIDTADAHITHVVVRTHYFLSHQEVAVPVAQVERFISDYILLCVSRRDVERLPRAAVYEAALLPALNPTDQDLVPEGPEEAGVRDSGLDTSHLEGAHLLAEEIGARLRARGFSDEEILDWAKAFLLAEHSGGGVELLAWIRDHELTPSP